MTIVAATGASKFCMTGSTGVVRAFSLQKTDKGESVLIKSLVSVWIGNRTEMAHLISQS